jgi:AraC family transcriptional regulator, positive regulator of tynA and feaB
MTKIRPGSDFTDVVKRTYEEWADALRAYPWGSAKVQEPKAFTISRSKQIIYGFEFGAIKHTYGPHQAYSVRRDYDDIRLDAVDHYHVLFQASGSASVIQNDQVAELAPGDTVLVDAGRPSVLINNGGIQFDLVLPRNLVTSHVGLELPGGLQSPRGMSAARTLRQIIFDADEGGELSDWANGQMQRVIFELVSVLFEPKVNLESIPDVVFKRVCDIVRDKHADPDLTPVVVAAEAGMSLRKLQALFTSRGLTCTEYIHSVRLERARFLMRRRESLRTNELLSQIAYSCGYRDHSYFSRVFQRKYGQAPSTYSKSHRDLNLEPSRLSAPEKRK